MFILAQGPMYVRFSVVMRHSINHPVYGDILKPFIRCNGRYSCTVVNQIRSEDEAKYD